MLTADLLRVRVRKGVVKPCYVDVDEDSLAGAALLVEAYRHGIGRPNGELAEALEGIIGHGTDFLLWRGLAKLLDDRSTFEPASPIDGPTIRQRAFELAFSGRPVDAARHAEILDELAGAYDTTPEDAAAALYADLADRQILTTFADIEPDALLRRYNLALAQAVLYRATSLTIRLSRPDPDRLRYLMGCLKFHGLMHRARQDGDELVVEVDGPASLFKLTRKYGLQMAVFLPAVALLDDWTATAALDWKGKDLRFDVCSADGLVSHYRARGVWRTDEEQWFEERFAEHESDWSLDRRGTIVRLRDGEVIVADYVLTSPEGDEVAVEIVSYWRAGYLRRRIDMLDSIEQPFVVVVSERLKADREKLVGELPEQVVFYKGVILPKKVVDAGAAAIARAKTAR